MYLFNKINGIKLIEDANFDLKEKHVVFNAVSDLHIEFAIEGYDYKGGKGLHRNVDSHVDTLYKNVRMKSDTLLLLGDYSRYNELTLILMFSLKRYWKNILVIFGNHDYRFKISTESRVDRLSKILNSIHGIECLSYDRKVVEIDGVRVGGATMWYDVDNPIVEWSFRIETLDSMGISYEEMRRYHKHDKEYYYDNINDVDIFLTHLPFKRDSYPLFGSKNSVMFVDIDYIKEDVLYLSGHIHIGMISEKYKNMLSLPGGYCFNDFEPKIETIIYEKI